MRPTYNALLIDIDDCPERVLFLTADLSELSSQIADLLKGSEIDLANHGCMPFFLIVRVRPLKYVRNPSQSEALLHMIFGADVPKLRAIVAKEAPAKATEA